MAISVGADLVDLVESGGRGGTRKALAVSRNGALGHWRDITAPYRKLDLLLPIAPGLTVEVCCTEHTAYNRTYLHCTATLSY
jgi:hypothetical protein